MLCRPYKQWPQIHAFLDYFVVLGQRGPTAVMVAAWLGWRAWRHRTLHPLLVLGTSLLLLNVTVGAVKFGLGRLGPHYATSDRLERDVRRRRYISLRSHRERRGDLGVLAYLATTPRARRAHLRDRGAAGAGRRHDHGLPRHPLGQRRPARLGGRAADPAGAALVRAPDGLGGAADHGSLGPPPRHRAGACHGPRRGHGDGSREGRRPPGRRTRARRPQRPCAAAASGMPHHPARPHTTRHERTPVTPSGSRRPPADRPGRPAPVGQTGVARGRGATG